MKDRIDKKEIEVQFCPTLLMVADYFTKPLQGRPFKLFRDLIMGYAPISTILEAIALSAKERVEKKKLLVTESSIMSNDRTYADVVKEGKREDNNTCSNNNKKIAAMGNGCGNLSSTYGLMRMSPEIYIG